MAFWNSGRKSKNRLINRIKTPQNHIISEFKAFNEESRKRKREIELKEARDYLQNLFDYANAPIIVWNPKLRITQFNHAFERMTGKTAQEVIGKGIEILFPNDKWHEAMAQIRRTLAGKRWEIVEIPIQHADGTVKIVLWNSANIYADDGKKVISTIAQGTDITERKHAEEEILNLSKFPHENPNIIMRFDNNGKILFYNPALNKILRLKKKKSFCDILPKDYKRLIKEAALKKQHLKDKHYTFNKTTISYDIIPIHGRGYVNVYGKDITKQKEAETKIISAHEKIQASEEELRASNEELRVTDEELRAANEELIASQQEIERHNVELKEKVKERTKNLDKTNKELRERIDELERFHNLVVGRELMMIKLKKRIKELEKNKQYREDI